MPKRKAGFKKRGNDGQGDGHERAHIARVHISCAQSLLKTNSAFLSADTMVDFMATRHIVKYEYLLSKNVKEESIMACNVSKETMSITFYRRL